MSNNNYYITEKGYKRQKCSLYLQKKVYEKLIEISEKNELSISECGQRLMVQSMGLFDEMYIDSLKTSTAYYNNLSYKSQVIYHLYLSKIFISPTSIIPALPTDYK